MRFHDYDEICKRPGLYEQLFYERLRYNSPAKVADLLQRALNTVRELIFSKYLDIYHLERYGHRLSMEGSQLFYYALVRRMTASIPEDFLEQYVIED